MRFLRRLAVATAVSCLLLPTASANVSVKNGDYFVEFTDISLPGGFEPTIDRIYNSKSPYKGLFGWGWGTEYEVYLEIEGDGTVTVHEYGGGAANIFRPPDMSQEEVKKVADEILAVAVRQSDVAGEQNSADYLARLMKDAEFRNAQWSNYLREGLLQQRQLPAGTSLVSMRFGHQILVVTRDGYRRTLDNGRTEFFGKDGKLRQLADRNNHYLLFFYDVPGQITLRDDASRSLVLTENDRGLIVRVESSNHGICTFRYNERDELVYSKDVDGIENTFSYDPAGRHNLIKIGHADGTTQEIAYYPREAHENVQSVKDRDGTVTSYTYDTDKQDQGHLTVGVSVKAADGRAISAKTYEYFSKTMPDGTTYTARLIQTIDGDRTDTTYNTAGLPLRIEENGEVTTLAYDDLGHLTHKETPDSITDMTYDPAANKISWVRIVNKKDPKDVQENRFTYDSKGNLLKAESGSKSVTLQYDSRGRISELDAADGRSLTFTYDENSKPVTINLLVHGKPSGSITVTYDVSGAIEKVSTDKDLVAKAVMTAYQELKDLVQPAGVDLSF